MENMAVYPHGLRVFYGYRHEDYLDSRDEFVRMMSDIFVPVTVQFMAPLGLCGFFAMVLPDTKGRFPDSVALLIFPSPAVYDEAVLKTSAGRAYMSLREQYYNLDSSASLPLTKSAFPSVFPQKLRPGDTCAFLGKPVDWHSGATYVAFIERPSDIDFDDFARDIQLILIQAGGTDSDECLVQIEDDFVILWEHSTVEDGLPAFIEAARDAFGRSYFLSAKAQKTDIAPIFSLADCGVGMSEGLLLDARGYKDWDRG